MDSKLETAPERLIDLRAVQTLTGVSMATIYRWVESGQFPRPVRLGRSTRWRLGDVLDHLDSLPSAEDAPVTMPDPHKR